MSAENPFLAMVAGYAALLGVDDEPSPRGDEAPAEAAVAGASGRGTALLFSPHPDDECITGTLALRLRREAGMRVVNVPVTLGSDPGRRAARHRELERACARLGFELAAPLSGGALRVRPGTRAEDPRTWAGAVEAVAAIVAARRPALVFLPHERDAHPTHIGTHLLVRDALATLGSAPSPLLVETEFWATMATPNLMVASRIADVADLVAALALHAGEVARNPYHLRLPAWMIDNVRRGAELIAGPGVPAPSFPFATLYRASRLEAGRPRPLAGGTILGTGEALAGWLGRVG